MAYVVERTRSRHRFKGMYVDPDGHKHSAGSFSLRREAQRAALRAQQKVIGGAWQHLHELLGLVELQLCWDSRRRRAAFAPPRPSVCRKLAVEAHAGCDQLREGESGVERRLPEHPDLGVVY